MKCQGDFIFKGLEKRDGGEFTNQRGQVIKYGDSYILKVDEKTEKGIYERKLKIDITNSTLIGKLQKVADYAPIRLSCDVKFYNNSVSVIPIDLVNSDNK